MALPIVRMNTRGLFPMRDVKLSDKYTIDEGTVLMTGTHALVRLPMLQKERDTRAGLDTGGFISGYRGSPLGSYDRELLRAEDLLESMDVLFQTIGRGCGGERGGQYVLIMGGAVSLKKTKIT